MSCMYVLKCEPKIIYIDKNSKKGKLVKGLMDFRLFSCLYIGSISNKDRIDEIDEIDENPLSIQPYPSTYFN